MGHVACLCITFPIYKGCLHSESLSCQCLALPCQRPAKMVTLRPGACSQSSQVPCKNIQNNFASCCSDGWSCQPHKTMTTWPSPTIGKWGAPAPKSTCWSVPMWDSIFMPYQRERAIKFIYRQTQSIKVRLGFFRPVMIHRISAICVKGRLGCCLIAVCEDIVNDVRRQNEANILVHFLLLKAISAQQRNPEKLQTQKKSKLKRKRSQHRRTHTDTPCTQVGTCSSQGSWQCKGEWVAWSWAIWCHMFEFNLKWESATQTNVQTMQLLTLKARHQRNMSRSALRFANSCMDCPRTPSFWKATAISADFLTLMAWVVSGAMKNSQTLCGKIRWQSKSACCCQGTPEPISSASILQP